MSKAYDCDMSELSNLDECSSDFYSAVLMIDTGQQYAEGNTCLPFHKLGVFLLLIGHSHQVENSGVQISFYKVSYRDCIIDGTTNDQYVYVVIVSSS